MPWTLYELGSYIFAEYIRDSRNDGEEEEENLFYFYDVGSNFLILINPQF